MSILARLFGRPQRSAHVAEERLRFVLAYERALTTRVPYLSAAERAARPVRIAQPLPPENMAPVEESQPSTAADNAAVPAAEPSGKKPVPVQMIRRSIHSGERLRYSGGLLILGDIHPAAHVIADGDIIVFGKLRGVAHAGAGGDETAVIAALAFAPTQARIGQQVLMRNGSRGQAEPLSELARVSGGQIVVEPWQAPANDSIPTEMGGS